MSLPVTTRRARAEAAAWLAKLHGPQRSTQAESGWRRWLAESDEHAAAWALATEAWGETGDLPGVLPRRRVPGSPDSWLTGLLRPAAILAICVCAVAVGWVIHHYAVPELTTSVGEERTLTLADGSRIELNTRTRVSIQFDATTRKVVLKSGEAYFAVAHERRPFVVYSGDRKIIAVGTAFVVRHDDLADDTVSVTLIEGRVVVTGAGAPDVLPTSPTPEVTLLSAGKRYTKGKHLPPTIDTPSIAAATAWRRGQLIFDDVPLVDAVTQFNRYNSMQIKLGSEHIGTIPVGGVFRTGDSLSFAIAVAESNHLRLTRTDQELLLE